MDHRYPLGVLLLVDCRRIWFVCVQRFETLQQTSETEKDLLEILHRFLHRTF